MMKKILAMILLAVMLLSAVSCASDSTESEPPKKKEHPIAQTEEEEDPSKEDDIDDSKANYWVDLVVAGQAQYTVVSTSKDYDQIAEYLAEGLRRNTGVSFPLKLSTTTKRVTGKKISIGKNPATLLSDPSELTYLGNLSVDRGETIYLTGYCKNAVSTTVDKFLAGVLKRYQQKDENGQLQVKAPDIRLFFLFNPPGYIKTSPKLLGVDLSKFVIVLPENMNATEVLMARELMVEIGVKTGCVIGQVTDKQAKAEHEIVLGETNRAESQTVYAELGKDSYRIQAVNGSLYVAYDNYLVMSDAREQIHEIYLNDTSANDPEIYCAEKPNYTAQKMHKQNDSYVRVMTSNIVCAGDQGARDNYDIEGITCELRVGIQGVMIMDYLPDFVGMQEMQEGTVNGVYSLMRTELLKTVGSEYSFVEYDNVPTADYWNPILYRHTVWQIEEKEASAPFDNGMHRWQWALFSKISNPDEKYIVMNMHYPISKEAEKQLAAANAVNEQIYVLKTQYPDVPIFLTGDYNACPGTETFESTLLGTGLATANFDNTAIDHVIYDPSLVDRQTGMFIKNGWIAKTSDHRPFFADFA